MREDTSKRDVGLSHELQIEISHQAHKGNITQYRNDEIRLEIEKLRVIKGGDEGGGGDKESGGDKEKPEDEQNKNKPASEQNKNKPELDKNKSKDEEKEPLYKVKFTNIFGISHWNNVVAYHPLAF